MLKHGFLLLCANFLVVNINLCQAGDSTVTYWRIYEGRIQQISSPDFADYRRVITTPDVGDTKMNVREYYKNGKLKLVGKYDWDENTTGREILSGLCTAYYSNGKKESIIHYSKNLKDGDETLFYPNGIIYCVKSNVREKSKPLKTLYVDCYDDKGIKICSGGNGKWLTYDEVFNLVLQGPVKDGVPEGDWSGVTNTADAIKYTYKYIKGVAKGGVGYDKNGNAYPFLSEVEPPSYKKYDITTFIRLFRSHLSIPKSVNKSLLDTAHFSFIIEHDGTLSHPVLSSDASPEVTEAFKAALLKCPGWNPRRYFGIPLKSRIMLPYREDGRVDGNYYTRSVEVREQILGFD